MTATVRYYNARFPSEEATNVAAMDAAIDIALSETDLKSTLARRLLMPDAAQTLMNGSGSDGTRTLVRHRIEIRA